MKKVHLMRIAVMAIAVTLLVFSSEGYAKKDVGSGLSAEDRYLKKVYVSEALDLMEKCEYKEALIKLTILAEKYPDIALYWSSLAQCHFELKAYEEAIAAADSACYVAKKQGSGNVAVYSARDEVAARQSGDFHWLRTLQTALRERGFRLYWQPIVPACWLIFWGKNFLGKKFSNFTGEPVGGIRMQGNMNKR